MMLFQILSIIVTSGGYSVNKLVTEFEARKRKRILMCYKQNLLKTAFLDQLTVIDDLSVVV